MPLPVSASNISGNNVTTSRCIIAADRSNRFPIHYYLSGLQIHVDDDALDEWDQYFLFALHDEHRIGARFENLCHEAELRRILVADFHSEKIAPVELTFPVFRHVGARDGDVCAFLLYPRVIG